MNRTITIQDEFWKNYRNIVRREMIPYQWKVLNDEIDIVIERERNDDTIPNEKSHAIENFKIAAGLKEGHHYGWVFQDSDVYKWLEAVAYSLQECMDEALKALADGVVELISQAQEKDGYLGTYFTIEEPDRKFKRLGESHELYCAGHFMEAAVAYHEATGNKTVLETACRLADCIVEHFGEEAGKIHGYDGHEEIEIGLARLYRVTGKQEYLDLSQYFLMIRGTDTDFFKRQNENDAGVPLIHGLDKFPNSYLQNHKPLLEQESAEGHAVRLIYLCTAMADVAALTKDESLLATCKRIWRNIVDKRMYITGGIGSTVIGESFTLDYDLPNDTMYCETCASVGLIFFARRLLENEWNGEYGDVMERALYNAALAGMALDGKHFFYVNPLEVVPENSKKDPTKSHVKSVRPQWLGCACCPPNLARLLASLEQYVYVQKDDMILANLFMNCEGAFEIDGTDIRIEQTTRYPWESRIQLHVMCQEEKEFTLAIRLPVWSERYQLLLNGQSQHMKSEQGILYIRQRFCDDVIELVLDMQVEMWDAHTSVRADVGKVAVSRGPMIYCMEGADNGTQLHLLSIRQNAKSSYEFQKDLLGGVGVIRLEGYARTVQSEQQSCLYQKHTGQPERKERELMLIPYYAWANRGENEMQVWIRQED